MQTSVIATVAKFFYFSSLNEQLTFAASFRVLGELKSHGWIEDSHKDRWISVLSKWRGKLDRISPRDWAHAPSENGFIAPAQFNKVVWSNFLGNAEGSEVEAVLLSRVLGFSDTDIARGLGVTVGTVRYRVGRGLRHLGGYLES